MSRRKSNAATCRIATPGKPCCFCGLAEDNEIEYGKLYELGTIVTHYYCLLLSSMMQQRGRDDEGILGFLAADIEKELRRGKRLTCCHCKKVGATLGCCNTKCKRIFHLPCGLKAGSLHQFYNEFRSFCINHRPKQLIDGRVLDEVKNAETTLCYICYDHVNYRDILSMLWAPCCKKNAFFHRKCVQQLANSSGYFFKCPLCNNKKEFQDAMLEHGIFIPSQDASWELVPNAYHELLYRHNQCDAETCVCPKGRNHSSSSTGPTNKWELILCRVCGSQGIHRHCGNLRWINSWWECTECQSILEKSPLVNRQIRESDDATGNAESGGPNSKEVDSDSDLSVGQDANHQTENNSRLADSNIPIVKVRPGPLSYKMKEVMKVAQSQPKGMTKGSSSSLEGTKSSTNLTESNNGGNKIGDDPNTVILLDSDEEAEDIKIISEKLNPKILTTNDGKKIEILNKRSIEELSKANQGKPICPNSMIPNLSQNDSKPTIMCVQTVNSTQDSKNANQIANLSNFNSKSGSESLERRNEIINNYPGQIIFTPVSNSGSATPQNFNQRVMNSQIPNFKIVPNTRPVNPQPTQNSPMLHQRIITSGSSPSQIPHPQLLSPGKQISTPPKNLSTSGTNFSTDIRNSVIQTQGKVLPANIPHFFPPPLVPEKEEDTLGIKITSVCSLAPDLFDNLESEIHQLKSPAIPAIPGNFPSAVHAELSGDLNLKRKAEIPGSSQYFEKPNLDTKRTKVLDHTIQSEEIAGKEQSNFIYNGNKGVELDKYPILRRNLVEEALVKANITPNDMMSAEINVRNNQPSTSSDRTTVNNYVAMPSSNMTFYMGNGEMQGVLNVPGKKAGSCQRNAITNAAISPRHGFSSANPLNKFGIEAEDQIDTRADSRIGNNSFEDSKLSDLCCSNSEGCHELSETSSSCDSAGLIPDNVSLSDVKFRVCGSDIVQVILYDKYRIDIKMDNTGSKSPRDSDSSPLPCPSLPDSFGNSQNTDEEIPRKRIRDFDFEENTLQEFPATSKGTNAITESPSNGVVTREKAAKENLNLEKSNSEEKEPKKLTATNFKHDLRFLRVRKNTGKSRTSSGVGPCFNCKVSIDLKKIWELIETKPHLFSKYNESLCKFKTHELKLAGICKIKDKWLMVKSQSQDNCYDVSTRSRLLYKSKSMEDLSAAKDTALQKKEEVKNCPAIKTNLRRGLKRKCRYSMPVR